MGLAMGIYVVDYSYISIGYLIYGIITMFLPELGLKIKEKNTVH